MQSIERLHVLFSGFYMRQAILIFFVLFFLMQVAYANIFSTVSALTWTILFIASMAIAVFFVLRKSSSYESTDSIFSQNHFEMSQDADETSANKVVFADNGLKMVAASREEALSMLDKLASNKKVKKTADQKIEQKHVFDPLPKGALRSPLQDSVVTFASLLVHGTEEEVMEYIREQRDEMGSLSSFLEHTALAFDAAYRNRLNGEDYVDPRILVVSEQFDMEDLEQLISILMSGSSHTYPKNVNLSAQLAITRALSFIDKRKNEGVITY